MSVSPSLVRRVLVILVIIVATICALVPQHPSATSASAVVPASTPAETASTANTPTQPMLAVLGTPLDTSATHGIVDCDGTACGNTHTCEAAVTLTDTSPTAPIRTGDEFVERTDRHPACGHRVPAESNSPPWTVLSLVQLSVSRV